MTKTVTKSKPSQSLVQAIETIMWPRRGMPIVRCRRGAILDAEDPLLNTERIAPELRDELGIEVSDQSWKTVPAPDGATVTPHHSKQAQAIYRRIGFERVPYAVGTDEEDERETKSPERAMPRAPVRRRAAATVPPIDGED